MNIWKFYDITHKNHILCNPMSIEKHEQMIDLLQLEEGARVLDIAMGKAEFIVRLAEKYGAIGMGVDISPYCVADAKQKAAKRVPDAKLEFIEMDGKDFQPDEPESFDLASCIGASWIFKGHEATLRFLISMVKPGGLVVAGEPYWLREPENEYLVATSEKKENYGTHYSNIVTGENLGLSIIYSIVSNQDDWDRYEGLQWNAVTNYMHNNPDDPDLDIIFNRAEKDRAAFLKWGRDTLGWAIYVFRKS